jgi:hypothetical protein
LFVLGQIVMLFEQRKVKKKKKKSGNPIYIYIYICETFFILD